MSFVSYTSVTLLWISLSVVSASEPIFSNLDIAQAIILDRDLRDRIEIAPEQIERLKVFLKGEKLRNALISVASKSINQISGEIDPAVRKARQSLDPMVYQECLMILSEEQFRLARKLVILNEYPTPSSAFKDESLLLRLKIASSDGILKKVVAAEQSAESKVSQVREKFIKEALATLPPGAQQRFVNYAGNRFLPELKATDVDFNSLPFSTVARTAPFAFLQNVRMREKVRITEAQAVKAEDVRNKLIENMRTLPLGDRDKAKELMDEMRKDASREFWGVFTSDQKRAFQREVAQLELETEPKQTFSRPELIAYLQLTREEAVRFNVFVFEQTTKVENEVAKIQCDLFREACSFLANSEAAAMREAFKGVWCD